MSRYGNQEVSQLPQEHLNSTWNKVSVNLNYIKPMHTHTMALSMQLIVFQVEKNRKCEECVITTSQNTCVCVCLHIRSVLGVNVTNQSEVE